MAEATRELPGALGDKSLRSNTAPISAHEGSKAVDNIEKLPGSTVILHKASEFMVLHLSIHNLLLRIK